MSYTPSTQPVRSSAPYSDYELIDVDPTLLRVVSFMRPADYAAWAASIAFFPAAIKAWEHLEPAAGPYKAPAKIPGGALRTCTLLGFVGGFYLAYVRSSKRFLGWSENSREVARDRYEHKKLLAEGKLPFGENESTLTDRVQDVANRNSQYAFTNMAILPWFNLVNHPYHGINLEKYYEDRPGEAEWGFQLKPLSEIREKYAKHIE